MRELLSPQNIDYMDRAREVAEKFVRPVAAELDRTGEYGWTILEALKDYELTGIWIPKEYGGQSAGVLDLCLVVEQLSRACGGIGVAGTRLTEPLRGFFIDRAGGNLGLRSRRQGPHGHEQDRGRGQARANPQ